MLPSLMKKSLFTIRRRSRKKRPKCDSVICPRCLWKVLSVVSTIQEQFIAKAEQDWPEWPWHCKKYEQLRQKSFRPLKKDGYEEKLDDVWVLYRLAQSNLLDRVYICETL